MIINELAVKLVATAQEFVNEFEKANKATTKLSDGADKLSGALETGKQKISDVVSPLNTLTRSADKVAKPIEGIVESMQSLSEEAADATSNIGTVSSSLAATVAPSKNLASATERASTSVQSLGKFNDDLAESFQGVSVEISDFAGSMREATEEVGELAESADKMAGSAGRAGSSVGVVGGRMGGTTASFTKATVAGAIVGEAIDDVGESADDAADSVSKLDKKSSTLGGALGKVKDRLLGLNPAMVAGGVAAVAVTTALVAMTVGAAAAAEALQKATVRTGTTAEELSQLNFAATQSGASLEHLEIGLRTVNRTAAMAQSGSKELKAVYDKLGVSLTDNEGRLKGTSQLLGEVADGLNKYETAGEKAALGTKILGEDAFGRLLPLLEGGSEGLAAMRAEAEAYGATISTGFANQSASFIDNVGRMKSLLGGMRNTIAERLLPVINKFLEVLIGLGKRVLPLLGNALARGREGLDRMRGILGPLFGAWEQIALLIGDVVVGVLKLLWLQLEPLAKSLLKIGKIVGEVLIQSFVRWTKVLEGVTKVIRALVKRDLALAKEGLNDMKTAVTASLEELTLFKREAEETAETIEDTLVPAFEGAEEVVRRYTSKLGDAIHTTQTFAEALEEQIAAGLALGPLPATAIEELLAGLGEILGKTKDIKTSWREFTADIMNLGKAAFKALGKSLDSFSGGLADVAMGGKIVFADFFKQLLRDLLAAIIRAAILRALMGFLNIGSIGSTISGIAGAVGGAITGLGTATGSGSPAPSGGSASGGSAAAISTMTRGAANLPVAAPMQVRVYEATPSTWVEVVDTHVAPRLKQRQEELGEEI